MNDIGLLSIEPTRVYFENRIEAILIHQPHQIFNIYNKVKQMEAC